MTVQAATQPATPIDDALARRNVLILALGQALGGANNIVMIATGAIAGALLAPNKALATLPVTAFVIGQWMGTLPVGALAQRFGRRTTFQIGASFGVLAGLLGYTAVTLGSFAIFLLATFCAGLYAASHQSYRFAAADTASDSFRPKAISLVMAGGVLAALFGPQTVILTKDWMPPYLFAASYLTQAGFGVVAIALLSLVRIPQPVRTVGMQGHGRPLAEIARQPRFVTAVACGVASFSLMNLVMTSAPLAMLDCNHSVTEATLGLQWHAVAMFAPSFFTGSLCVRFGAGRVTFAGLAMIAASALVGIAGISLAHFWIALILLGLGWNFGLIGATTMVTTTHRPEERIRVQAFNDFLVFGSLAVSSLVSGSLLAFFGWTAVNLVVFPVVLAAAALLLTQFVRARHQIA